MTDINPIVQQIIKKRGYTTSDEIEEFVSEKPKKTYDPFLLANMEEGVDFILSAINNDEKICIYGDYDVDGITSTSLLYCFFSRFTDNVTYFIPSRFDDGYGLNNESLKKLKDDGVQTVITVDCGAVSKNEVAYAKDIGLKIIVTDHHNMEEETSPDCIVINPKHPNSKYPFDGLCGCGVAFKIVQAISRKKGISGNELGEYLDLVAIATVADVVPLIDENRTLLKYGLKQLNKGRRKSLKVMANKLGIKPGTIDSYKIGFVIGPHMNAAGRMEDANAVVQMLITEDNSMIDQIVDTLITHNQARKEVQEKCYSESVEIIEENYKDSPFLIVRPTSIHEGIAGIVAGKLKETYNKPAIVLSQSQDEDGTMVLKGSGRSISGVDLVKTLFKHRDLFIKLGGHSMAAGFSLTEGNEKDLRQALTDEMNVLLKDDPNLLTPKLDCDATIDAHELKISLAEDFNLLAPYGLGNPRPVLKIEDVPMGNPRYMGQEKKHVKFGDNKEYVLFGEANKYESLLESDRRVDIYGNPDINLWNGRKSVQFIVKNIAEGEA